MGAPLFLNDDGSASMATLFMMAHHGFRRDLVRLKGALASGAIDAARTEALRERWKFFRDSLHGHHGMEDAQIFPHLRTAAPAVAPVIERLGVEHRQIDPLLERGDAAFAALSDTARAVAVVEELRALLDPHLATEEAELVPLLRNATAFPVPANDAEAELYAHGFAWSMADVAPDVVARVLERLPENLTSRLPAAQKALAAKCERAWGVVAPGAARTPIPT